MAEMRTYEANGVEYIIRDTAAEAHENNKENPHGVTAEQVKARPDTWMPTAEEVGARPNTWMPTAEEVGARPKTWIPTLEDIGAAPVGYVEATYDCTTEAEVDEVLMQKLDQMDNNRTAFIDFNAVTGVLFTGARVTCMLHRSVVGFGCAEFMSYGTTGAVVWRKSIYNGVVLPIEWVNPPMTVNQEYRTTERYDGKPVYTKFISFGSMPNNTSRGISVASSKIHMVSLSGVAKADNDVNVFPVAIGGQLAAYAFLQPADTDTKLYVRTLTDMSKYTAEFVIKYIKD